MTLYVCPICHSEHAYWDDSHACFKVCLARVERDVEHSCNVKVDVPELVCECAAADLERRGLVFVFSSRPQAHTTFADKDGLWAIVRWDTKRSVRQHFFVAYCPCCGRKPRPLRLSAREPKG